MQWWPVLQVWKLYKKGQALEIMDPTLASTAVPEQVSMCIQIGLLCVQSDPNLRPTMRRVVVMLSKKPRTLDEPTRPSYPGTMYRRSQRLSGSISDEHYSHAAAAASASTSNPNTTTTSTLKENLSPEEPRGELED